jgi:hypothetical protein
MRNRTWRSAAVATFAAMCLMLTGCGRAGPAGKIVVPAPRAEEPDAPIGEAIADPVLREARRQNDTVLVELLVGRAGESGNARIAEKIKGYQTFSVKSQKLVRDGVAEFSGLLTGPKGRADFRLTLVKQRDGDGKWAIATFSGPNPE